MSLQTTFFLTPPPLSLRSRAHGLPSSPLTHRRQGPVMLTPVTTAAGLITVSAASVGLFFVLGPKLFPSEPKTPPPDATPTPPAPPSSTAVIGLSQPDAPPSEPLSPLLPTPPPTTSPVPQLYMDSINPALFDFRDELSIKQNRLSEEFEQSAGILAEMDTIKSVVVVDGDRDVVWVAGASISGNVSIPSMSKLIKEEGDSYVMSSREGWVFMGEEVKEVGVVKMKQGLIAVGGNAEGFFGEMEKRMTLAVANKLGTIMEVGKALGPA